MQMVKEIINWINLENEDIENQVLSINGDFGTGKTHFITKDFNWKKVNKNSIYINLNNNFIDKLTKFFTDSKDANSKTQKEEEDFIKKIKNCLEEKSLLKINAFDNIKIIEKAILNFAENKKDFFNNSIIVFDDIERNNPENIVKALGLIDQLSSKYKKMKILVPYNSKALNDVLNNFFGIQNIQNKENYLQKYLDNSIDFEVNYDELANFIKTKLITEEYFLAWENCSIKNFQRLLKKLNISWRNIIHLKNLKISWTKTHLGEINYEDFVKNNGLILFNKDIFKNNVINLKNENYLILDKDCSICNSSENKKVDNKIKNELLQKTKSDGKTPIGIKTTNDIVTIWNMHKDIYEFFKKYHNH